jgi:glycosyltransferase involved in cell wall biosynthesis
VHVLFYLFFPAGGIGKYTDRQLRELSTLPGIEAEAACPPDFQWRRNAPYEVWSGLFRISSRWSPLRKLRFMVGQFLSPRRALARARASGAELLHVCNVNYLSFPFWRGALRRWGGRLLCTAHDVRRGHYVLSRRWGERQLRNFYRACDAIFVHSDKQARELVQFAGIDKGRIHVVPHGPTDFGMATSETVDRLRERYGLPADGQLALCFGFLRPQKNLEGLLRAFAAADVKGLRLLVVGNVPPGGELQLQRCMALLDELALRERVNLDVRYVPDDEVPALVTLADWLVLPYRADFSSQSGILNLAAHYERPVLATPTASLAEALREEPIGLLCEGFEEAQLVAGIGAMVRQVRQGKVWPFARYRERHSWRRNADLTVGVYRSLLESRP